MGISVRAEGKKVNSNINVTPMVDVMLVLLIIFMVITPMLQKGVSVDMAKVNNPVPMQDADKEVQDSHARRLYRGEKERPEVRQQFHPEPSEAANPRY